MPGPEDAEMANCNQSITVERPHLYDFGSAAGDMEDGAGEFYRVPGIINGDLVPVDGGHLVTPSG